MSALRVALRLSRFSGRYFALNLGFAVFNFLVVPLIFGLAAQAFFDALTGRHRVLDAMGAVVVIAVVQVAEAASSYGFGSPWSPLQQKANVLLRRNLFAAILAGYGRHGLTESTGEIVNRFRDDPERIADMLDCLCDLIGRSLFVVVAAVIMWRVDPLLTVVLFVPVLVCAWILERLGGMIARYRAAARGATGRFTGFLGGILAGQLALTVGGASSRAVDRMEALGHVRRRAEIRDSVFGALRDAFSINLGTLGTGIVLLVGAEAMRSGSLTVGDFALFAVFLDAMTWYPEEIGRLIGGLKQIDVSLGRIEAVAPGHSREDLVEMAPVLLENSPPEFRPPWAVARRKSSRGSDRLGVGPEQARSERKDRLERLEVEGLTFRHPVADRGVEDVSFALVRGSVTVVTGRIGSGKSTLLEVLLGLRQRTGGTIRWNGREVDDPSTFFVPPRTAYTAQVPRLLSDTVRHNVALGLDVGNYALERAVRAAVLEPDVRVLERGLETPVGPRGVRLSGGQVQRVAAARMFIRDADLLVFDDLSSALDAETEAELWRRLFDGGAQPTCLVVSHRPAVLARADQVLVIEDGRLRRG
jgi:ATP-binding cassette, subfamily B, bacterial